MINESYDVLDRSDLARGVFSVYQDLGLIDRFSIPIDVLSNFLQATQSQYRRNPFHNFAHAVDVLYEVYFYVKDGKADRFLTHLDVLALITASLCHDLDHPGKNNSFLIKARDHLSILYNDRSPLENHHAASAFMLLSHPENNILVNLSPSEYDEVRASMITSILATDMTKHAKILRKLQSDWPNLSVERKSDRTLSMKLIIKCADVNNVCKPYALFVKWVAMLLEEFRLQADLEHQLGLPSGCTYKPDHKEQVQSVAAFLDFVEPLFLLLEKLLPHCSPRVKSLRDNKFLWATQLLPPPLAPVIPTVPEDKGTKTTAEPITMIKRYEPTSTVKDILHVLPPREEAQAKMCSRLVVRRCSDSSIAHLLSADFSKFLPPAGQQQSPQISTVGSKGSSNPSPVTNKFPSPINDVIVLAANQSGRLSRSLNSVIVTESPDVKVEGRYLECGRSSPDVKGEGRYMECGRSYVATEKRKRRGSCPAVLSVEDQ